MKTGCGAALLEDIDTLRKIVKTLSDSVPVPLTCKIRLAEKEDRTIALARVIEQSGAKAVTVHGRTARQKYSGKSDWGTIRKIKQKLGIPVILNGDVIDEISAAKAFSETGCDAAMIGRAAIGNPWLFHRISHYLKTGHVPEPGMHDLLKQFSEYLELCRKYGYADMAPVKMQAQHFTKGIQGSRSIRQEIAMAHTLEEIERCTASLLA